MGEDQRAALIDNTARNMDGVTENIRLRHPLSGPPEMSFQRDNGGRVPNRGVSGPSPENRRHPCEVNLSLRPPSGQWRSL